MVQRVQDEDGSIHEFPDDATQDEINSSFAQVDHERKLQNFQKATGINQPSLSNDIAGGWLHGLAGLAKTLPDMGSLGTPGMQKISNVPGERPIDKFDAYKTMGTEEKPITTLGGLAQTAGELYMPGKAVSAGAGTLKAIGEKIAEKFSPGKASENLLENLGKGAANTEESTKAITQDIQNSHNMREDEATAYLKHPMEQAGQEKIYEHVDPLITTKMDKAKSMIDTVKDLNVGELYDAFKNKPTFQNSHNLQSELGVMIGDLQKIPGKTGAERLQLQNIKSVRDSLKSDISDFLKRRDENSNENLAPMYQKGIDLYRENVAPYLSSKKLREIVRQGKTVVNNVHDIFKNPTDLVDRFSGNTTTGPINKILSDLPEETKGKILFNKIGGFKNSDNPEALAKSINNAEQQGHSSLMNQNIKDQLLGIKSKARNQEMIKTVAKTVAKGILPGILPGFLAEELIRRSMK